MEIFEDMVAFVIVVIFLAGFLFGVGVLLIVWILFF